MTPTVVYVLLLVEGSYLLGDGVLWLSRGVRVVMCVFVPNFPSVVEVSPDDGD